MTQFSDLKLDPKVLKAIEEAGYTTPTPIQAGAIPPALEGKDVLGIAQTGTGKTASFTLPMITRLARGRARARMPRSLVLCPTRELAAQVAENFDIYAKNTRLTKALLIGGVSFGEQDKLIDRGVDVLIATPGRLLDHFERGKLLLTGVEVMVVDEADRMLDMGFIPDIERIFQLTPFTRQTLFFSATMAPEIERITNTFLHSPERIEVARQASASQTITQRLVEVSPARRDQTAKTKRELLRALIAAEGEGLKNAIIFCNRKTDVDIVAKSLKKHGLDAAPIHGDLEQSLRTRTLDDFREGKLRFLIASDVAARGLDIPAVSHVFNYDLPSHAEDYVHRIGRTGRAGRDGTAISLAVPSDEKYLTAIEGLLKKALPRGDLPEGFSASGGASRSSDRGSERNSGRSGKSSGGRGGRNSSRNSDSERSEKAEKPAPVATPAREEAEPVREAARKSEPAPKPRHSDRSAPERSSNDRNSTERGPQGARNARNGANGHDRRRDGPTPLGMGDHVPEFLTRSFRPEDFEVMPSRDEAPETSEPQAEADAPKPKSRRSRSRKSADTAAPREETAREDDAKPVQAEAASEAAPTETAEAAPKPRRRRRTKAEIEADKAEAAQAPTTDEAAPAPKRRRRKTTDSAAPAETAAESADTGAAQPDAEAPKPKRKRAPRKPKAESTDTPTSES